MSRKHVLDVKLRSSQVRARRMRLAAVALAVTFGTVFGLYLCWRAGEWALNRFVYENPEFAIRHIDARTDGAIAPEQLRRWSGVKLGENLMALDLGAVRRNLQLVSTIGSVSVERVLPGTLRIRVTERRPVAQVDVPRAGPGGGIEVTVLQLDARGDVMRPLDPRQCAVPLAQIRNQLPVITGLNVYRLGPGQRVESPRVRAALRLLAAFNRSAMAGLATVGRLDVSSPGVVVATTAQGAKITFGLDNLEEQLQRWREIYDLGQRMNKAIATLDLAVTNNVPVRWTEVVPTPVATPEQNTTPTRRRRNV